MEIDTYLDKAHRDQVEFNNAFQHKSVMNVVNLIESGVLTEMDVLKSYKRYIADESYGKAKAISNALKFIASGYDVKDTHDHIENINTNKWSILREERENGFDGSYDEFFKSTYFEDRVRESFRKKT